MFELNILSDYFNLKKKNRNKVVEEPKVIKNKIEELDATQLKINSNELQSIRKSELMNMYADFGHIIIDELEKLLPENESKLFNLIAHDLVSIARCINLEDLNIDMKLIKTDGSNDTNFINLVNENVASRCTTHNITKDELMVNIRIATDYIIKNTDNLYYICYKCFTNDSGHKKIRRVIRLSEFINYIRGIFPDVIITRDANKVDIINIRHTLKFSQPNTLLMKKLELPKELKDEIETF